MGGDSGEEWEEGSRKRGMGRAECKEGNGEPGEVGHRQNLIFCSSFYLLK